MGTSRYDTILQLVLFCRRQKKWDEVPYADLFVALRNDHETRKKRGLPANDSNVMLVTDEKKEKPRCRPARSIGKRCVKMGEEEDVQLLVATESGSDRGRAAGREQNGIVPAGPEGSPPGEGSGSATHRSSGPSRGSSGTRGAARLRKAPVYHLRAVNLEPGSWILAGGS